MNDRTEVLTGVMYIAARLLPFDTFTSITGNSIRKMRVRDYLTGYLSRFLEEEGLIEYSTQILHGLVERVMHAFPDKAHDRSAVGSLITSEAKDYLTRWKMYNELFRKAA